MKRIIAVCVIAALATGCSAPAETTPEPSATVTSEAITTRTSGDVTTTSLASEPSGPDWAMPGLKFLDALGAAFRAGDTEALLGFYHPDARLFAADAGGTATGWRQIAEVIERQPPTNGDPGMILIGDRLGAVLSPAAEDCNTPPCPAASIEVFWIWDGAIGVQFHSSEAPLDVDDPLVDLFVGSAEAYSEHDVEGMRSFYSDAVFAPPFPIEEYEGLFAAFPDLRADPLTLADLGLGGEDRLALFDLGSTGAGSSRSRTAVGVYEVTFAPDVSTVAASLWRLWDGRILEAATIFDPSGWDRMLQHLGVDPPPSWFTSIDTPEPRTVERTHVVGVGDGAEIELFDATDATAALVEWSLGRFAAAGLEPPHVDEIHVETERSCLEESAWTHLSSESAIIRLCLDASELEDGGTFSLAGEFTMLHELAHVWTAEYLTEQDRASFLSLRGLETWNDASAAWSDRGNEHASEIIAWGLADEAIELVRLGSPDCAELMNAFRSLTGAQPLQGC